jgi:hypothetical protein
MAALISSCRRLTNRHFTADQVSFIHRRSVTPDNDRAIKQQEHADVKANGGYLTPAQQKQINQEENANSKLIHDEKHPQ